jgi:hypothetical protein
MFRPEQIPDEVYDAVGIPKWQAQAYLLAMLNAWLDMETKGKYTVITLPLKDTK